jgi:hypothetical protein
MGTSLGSNVPLGVTLTWYLPWLWCLASILALTFFDALCTFYSAILIFIFSIFTIARLLSDVNDNKADG